MSLIIEEKFLPVVPPLPARPLSRIIKEGCINFCEICGSTISRNGLLGLFGEKLCHNNECQNSISKKIRI